MSISTGELEIIGAEFDSGFYAEEYPDLRGSAQQLLEHFCRMGWFEGRNPNPYFDTTSYLLLHPDVAEARMNPFFHYLYHGRRERRRIGPGVSPSTRALLLFGHPLPNWVDALRPEVDIDYYRARIPGPVPEGFDPVAHFAFRGWREGLSPSAGRRIDSMSLLHPQAVALLVNPVLAHLEFEAGRYHPQPAAALSEPETAPAPATAGSDAGSDLPQRDIGSIAQAFDREFYLTIYQDVAAAGLDPLEHYFYTGWREGRNPSPDFDTAWYLAEYPDVAAMEVDPFWHWLVRGRKEGRLSRNPAGNAAPANDQDADQIALMRTEFSATYYLTQNPDVARAGVDPVEHYHYSGWREGRNPTKTFDTRYYLEANEDVRDAGLNPFWHFLVAGRKEGRPACRPGGYRRRIIEAARHPEERSRDYKIPPGKPMTRKALAGLVDRALAKAAGLVVSLSHDCYIRVIGGTQIFIADEHKRFAEREFAYIHLSPRRGRLNLAPFDSGFEVQIVIDGKFAGFAGIEALIAILQDRAAPFGKPRLMVVHSALGFHEDHVLRLRAALDATRCVFWLHDYTSLCEGFNLLRNDLAFCHAPAPDSTVCRVCIYGETRQQHLERMRRLFEGCGFDVLSPSAFTLDLWRSRTQLPCASAAAHPHWQLESIEPAPPLRASKSTGAKAASGARRGKGKATQPPVRIGFVGFPSASKGWEIFSALVDEFHADPRYRFVHFAARGVGSMPECEFVVTETTPDDREATTRLLHEHRIDFLAMLSPWPETFSFVAHEAIAGGCLLLCLKDSGNVAALVRRTGYGLVFEDAGALPPFLRGDEAVALAAKARARPHRFRIVNDGTTATVRRFFEEDATP